jgi:hypothetical protein
MATLFIVSAVARERLVVMGRRCAGETGSYAAAQVTLRRHVELPSSMTPSDALHSACCALLVTAGADLDM